MPGIDAVPTDPPHTNAQDDPGWQLLVDAAEAPRGEPLRFCKFQGGYGCNHPGQEEGSLGCIAFLLGRLIQNGLLTETQQDRNRRVDMEETWQHYERLRERSRVVPLTACPGFTGRPDGALEPNEMMRELLAAMKTQ